jgi:hypothetical protein
MVALLASLRRKSSQRITRSGSYGTLQQKKRMEGRQRKKKGRREENH